MSQLWTNDRVLGEIHGFYEREGRINSKLVQTKYSALYQAACKGFGTWKNALTAAGYDYNDHRKVRAFQWTKERVTEEVLKVYKADKKINSNHVQLNHHKLYQAGLQKFGSWKATIAAAGLDYDVVSIQKQLSWTKQSVIEEVKRRHNEGLPLNGDFLSKHEKSLYREARIHFGKKGWSKVLLFCGIDPLDISPKRVWKKDKVLKEIKRLASLDIPLYSFYLMRNGYGSLVAGGTKCFGSWRAAIEATGFDYEKVRAVRHNYWTQEKVITEIKLLAKAGTPLSSKFVQGIRADLTGAAIKCFGDWSKAVTAAGFDYDKIKLVRHYYWTKAKVIEEIKNLDKAGVRLNSQAVRKRWGDLAAIGKVLFGTWSQAVEAAGINYLEHCMVWSTKAWLKKLTSADVEVLTQRADELTELLRQNERKKKMNKLLARSVVDIPLENIIVSKANARELYNEGELVDLQDAIGRMGQIYPVVLRKINETKFELIIGTRRLKVAYRRKALTIPAFITDEIQDKDIVILALSENLHRSDLTPFEEAKAMLKLCKDYNMDTKDVAKQIGKGQEFVCGRLKILSLPEEVQVMLCQDDGISFTHANILGSLKRPRDQIRYAKLVAKQSLSHQDLLTLIQEDVSLPTPRLEGGSKRRLFSPQSTVLKVKRFDKFLNKKVRPRLALDDNETRELRAALRQVRESIKNLLGHSTVS